MSANVSKHTQLTANWRFYLVVSVIVLVYLSIAARTAYLQVIEPEMLKTQGDRRSLRTAENRVHRGSIVDRNGIELAVSVPVETVWADPKIIMENNALAKVEHWQALAEVLDKDVIDLKARVSKSPSKRFVYIERQISPAIADYIKQLKIPGIHLKKESKRFYPTGEISTHFVGYTDIDDSGESGTEFAFNDVLTGVKGSTKYRKDAKGNRIEVLETIDPIPPKDVVLSVDQRIQALAYRELKGAVKAFKASSGSVIVADVHTGEILALANAPSYNPNNRSNVAIHRMRNRAITDFYEPGSVMKPFAVLTALEFGEIEADTVIDTSKRIMRIGGRRVGDPRNYGKQTPTDILVNSSNLGTSMLALSLPKEFYLDKFFEAGFGERTQLELKGESHGIMHDRPRWSQIELATLSYGMGLSATPVQLARFYSMLGNGGTKKPLTIIKRDEAKPYEESKVFDSKNTEAVLAMLEQVVERKVTKAKVDGYRVGGKTGTAFKAVAGSYGNDYVGLFSGVAPISDPKVVVVVVINEPGGDLYHGGEIAAPVFSRVMQGALRLLNVEPDADTKVVKATNRNGGDRV